MLDRLGSRFPHILGADIEYIDIDNDIDIAIDIDVDVD